MKPSQVPYEGRRMDAAAHGYIRYKWSTCVRCGGEVRYTSTGNCVDCTNRRAMDRHAVIAETLKKARAGRP